MSVPTSSTKSLKSTASGVAALKKRSSVVHRVVIPDGSVVLDQKEVVALKNLLKGLYIPEESYFIIKKLCKKLHDSIDEAIYK
jgi:hypothetical protein